MLNKNLGFLILCGAALASTARADDFQLTGPVIATAQGNGVDLNISTSGSAPAAADLPRYRNAANWQIMWRAKATDAPTRVAAASADVNSPNQKVTLHVGANLPTGDPRSFLWTVLFLPPREMAAVPAVFTSTALNAPVSSSPGPSHKPAVISAVQAGGTPDISLSGTFLAGGNTKPIYTLQEQASLYYTRGSGILGFIPGFSSAVAINQGAEPPNNRTRFDPDSITGALSLWRVDPIQKGILYGMETKIDVLNGEFARTDPSSNLTAGFLTNIVLERKRLTANSFFVLHPALGLEAGHNLNSPSSLQGTPVDLSHYGAIFRGIAGADAVLAYAPGDHSSTAFSITGTYRVRLPATDEPFVESLHGKTIVDLTTKARHWVEVDIVYSPPAWKYIGLTAKYQYGSLPPIFSFVDQQVSIGLLFQAKQNGKPAL